MGSRTLMAVAGGCLSGCAWLAAAFGAAGPLGIVFAYFAPLPLLLVGLGIGGPPMLAACVAALMVVLVFAGLPAAEAFGAVLVLPCWLISFLALRTRPGANGAASAWQPIGTILALLAALASALLAAVGIALSGRDGLEATVRRLVDAVGQLPGFGGPEQVAVVQPLIAVFPGMLAVAWLTMLVINAVFAQQMLAGRGRAVRPTPSWSAIELPDWFSWLLVASAALSLISDGDVSYAARNVAIALLAPFFFVGLAVVHVHAGQRPARRVLLIGFYIMLMLVFLMVAAVVTMLGVLDQWRVLRLRPDPAARPPSSPGTT